MRCRAGGNGSALAPRLPGSLACSPWPNQAETQRLQAELEVSQAEAAEQARRPHHAAAAPCLASNATQR